MTTEVPLTQGTQLSTRSQRGSKARDDASVGGEIESEVQETGH